MKFTKGYAVLVGVGADLPVTVRDAIGLADLLRDPKRCAFPFDQVQVLTESEANCADVLSALDGVAESAGPEAMVIIYFSGHGYQITSSGQSKSFHLLTNGYNLNNLSDTTISGNGLTANLRAIQAKKLLVLLDCCHAGGIGQPKDPDVTLSKSPLPLQAGNILSQGSGRVILASSRGDELSYTATPYSQFTLALLEALAGAGAAERDGYARVLDMAMYVGRMVPNRTSDKQHPIIKVANLNNNFAVAYYAAGTKEPLSLPQMGDTQPQVPLAPELTEGYHKLLRKYRHNLLKIEIAMAEFIDQRMVPPDLLKARELVVGKISKLEMEYGSKPA